MRKFLFLIICVTIAISYFYSERVYKFYLQTYYFKILKKTKSDMLQEVNKLLNEKDVKQQAELKDKLQALFLLYPDDKKISYYQGIYLLNSGNEIAGAEKISSVLNGFSVDGKILNHVITIYYKNKYYNDVVYILDKYPNTNNQINYYYGVSLYNIKKYEKAINILKKVRHVDKFTFSVNLYIGNCYFLSERYSAAIPYLETAYRYTKHNKQLNRYLITAYTKQGKFIKAEKILRRIK